MQTIRIKTGNDRTILVQSGSRSGEPCIFMDTYGPQGGFLGEVELPPSTVEELIAALTTLKGES